MTATYTPSHPIWCAGCGHFGVQAAMTGALAALDVPSHEVMVLAGIGCSGTVQNNMGTYGYHALHGRVLPTATGVQLANPDLTVIATGGDGDGYAIGMGHLVHTFRRNPSLTYIVMNNGTYGLTKGQDSPTHQDTAGRQGIDAIVLGLSIPATTFLARGFARRADQLNRLTVAALDHARSRNGFAFLEILSPCVTYNDTYAAWEATLTDVDTDPAYDPSDRAAAFATVTDLGAEGRIAVGLIYRGPPAETAAAAARPALEHIDPAAHESAYREILAGYRI